MAQRATAEVIQHTAANDIMAEVAQNPVIVLTDKAKMEAYIAALKAEAEASPGNVNSEKGREQIRSNAANIGRRKAAIEKERLRVTEEWRQKTSTVNATGKIVKEQLQALQDEVRAPLTAWEESEAARKAEADRLLELLRNAAIVRADETAADVQTRLDEIRGLNLNDEILGIRTEMAVDLRDDAVKALGEALARLKQAEEERAELARLREREEQRQREETDRIAREREEKARQEREESERQAEERRRQEEAVRIERERQEAADRAVREAEAKAERERQEAVAAAQAEIDAANARAAEAERAAQAERDRIAAAEQARKEEEARVAAAQAQREADLEHRSNVMRAAKEALIASAGLPESKAKAVVLQIAAGNIPAVSIAF